MFVNIYSTVFIITLFLCIQIPSSISADETASMPISQNDEDNQTTTINEHSIQIDDNNVLSNSNLESIVLEVPPSIEENQVLDEEITTQSTLNSEIPTADEPQSTLPTKINHSHIDSFEEWKQQQLLAESSRKGTLGNTQSTSSETPISNNIKDSSSSSSNFQQISSSVSSSKKGKLRKNFASASCGAKILAHNTEAQNVGSILSSSPDEYMLNPCNAKIWFVIELCESIRILNIEIANFELFSSVPKTFRVSASDRYPTKDWHRYHLGTFNASFNRTIQSFQATLSTTYLKYLKFELLDFHGHEHYCPLSVVRIHGSNVEDEIMTMEDITNHIELKSLTDVHDDNDDDDDDLTNDQQVGGIIGSAILDLAKRVFRRQTIRGTQSTTTNPVLETNDLKNDCHPKVFNNSLTNESLQTWRQTEKFKQCIANFLFGLWSTFNTCTIYFSQICFQFNYCCQCPPMRTNQYRIPRVKSSVNFYIHPCGYYHILTSHLICQKEKFIELNKTNSVKDQTQDLVEEQHQPINQTIVLTNETRRDANLSTNQSTLNLKDNQSNETIDQQSITTNATEQPTIVELSNETIPISDSAVSLDTTEDSISSSHQTNVSESNTIDIEIPETTTENNHIDETTLSPTPSIPTNHDVMPPLISSPWLKGMLVNTKSLPELFKIIEKLNFNLTLSNRYLQELSQHYVKKLDETQHTTNLLLQSSKAADEKLANLEEQVSKFHGNTVVLSERLNRLEAYNSVIVTLIICLFIWCCILNCRIRRLKSKYRHILSEFEEIKKLKQIDDEDDNEPPVYSNGLTKRRLSTDSSDSNPTRSQRVPDDHLTKITENGFDQIEHKLNGVSSIIKQNK